MTYFDHNQNAGRTLDATDLYRAELALALQLLLLEVSR